MRTVWRWVLAASLVVAASCGDDDARTAPSSEAPPSTLAAPPSRPSTEPTVGTAPDPDPPALAEVELVAVPVASFEVPTAFRLHPDRSGWVAEKAGRVVSFETGAVALDVTDRVRDSGEMGFLGFAFDRTGERIYVSYNDDDDDGASVFAEYPFTDGVADLGAGRELLRVDQPYANHNGGDIHLGPDGMVWIGLGDGGSAGDPHGHGQDTDTLLGSILRIDPTTPGQGGPYGIPADNPFVDGGGLPEIWLFGVRNPWRFSFDALTGDLWVADVGQDRWEEIDLLPAVDGRGRGANLGWNLVEGTHRFAGEASTGAVPPVFEYGHDEGCSVTGGHVYRGRVIPALQGAYLFADFCQPTLRAIRVEDGHVVDEHTFAVDVGTPISFGVTRAGETLVLTEGGTVFELRARDAEIAPASWAP